MKGEKEHNNYQLRQVDLGDCTCLTLPFSLLCSILKQEREGEGGREEEKPPSVYWSTHMEVEMAKGLLFLLVVFVASANMR